MTVAQSLTPPDMKLVRQSFKFPILTIEQEREKFIAIENGDLKAERDIIQSHMRLAAKAANQYRNYGFHYADLFQEACVGLSLAVKRFDSSRGLRFSSYAEHWIKSEVTRYILNNWNIVKQMKTSNCRSLFFRLSSLLKESRKNIENEQIEENGAVISVSLDDIFERIVKDNPTYKLHEVKKMYSVISIPEMSTNMPWGNARGDRGDDNETTFEDTLVDDSIRQDEQLETQNYIKTVKKMVKYALSELKLREREIITRRCLLERQHTLEEIGHDYSLSKERIRQIENKAKEIIKNKLKGKIHHVFLEYDGGN